MAVIAAASTLGGAWVVACGSDGDAVPGAASSVDAAAIDSGTATFAMTDSATGTDATGDGDSAADGSPATATGDGQAACQVQPIEIVHDGGYVKQTTSLHLLDTATYPDAVCNDGTPALYAVRPGYGGGSKRWLISLEGGGSCIDQGTCQTRRDSDADTGYILTTSAAGLMNTGEHGILADDPTANPDFYDANEVRIHYCSSDSWEGAGKGQGTFSDSDPGTWSFQGHAIVAAVVSELLTKGLADATEVVLEGESAGGAGVFYNANTVASMLPAGVRFVAVPDAAFAIDVPGYDKTADGGISADPPPYPEDQKQTQGLAFWQGYGDPLCDPDHDAGAVECSSPVALLATHAYPMPFFVRQSEEDFNKFGDLGAPSPLDVSPTAEPEQAYYTFYEQQQRLAQNAIPYPYSVFGPNITDHIDLLGGSGDGPYTFDTPVFTFPDGEMLSTEAALHIWYADPCTQHHWVQ